MFLSKIWFLIVVLVAGVAAAVAFVAPRPAARDAELDNRRRLVLGCSVVKIQLQDAARKRISLAGTFAREKAIVDTLGPASAAEHLGDDEIKKAHAAGEQTMKEIKEDRPTFAMLIDGRGRVVARVGIDDADATDIAAGRPLVDQALAGYLADDLWVLDKGKLFFVVGSPVVRRSDLQYIGAIVLGYGASKDFASKLVVRGADKSDDTQVGFFLGADTLVTSEPVAIDTAPLVDAIKERAGSDAAADCRDGKQVAIRSGTDELEVLASRLPGEAGGRGAYVAVYTGVSEAPGLVGTIKRVEKGDLGFGSFPWLLVIAGFIVALGGGIALMVVEADRPLRRLVADTVQLAEGKVERLAEDKHGGKFGSIARSVNIHIDKVAREAKTAKKDLDQLLGPAPEGSLGTIDLLATAMPSAPQTATALPPPSEFHFNDGGGQRPTPTPAFAPPPAFAPQQPAFAPQQQAFAPPQQQAFAPPPQQAFAPPQQAFAPPQQAFVPPAPQQMQRPPQQQQPPRLKTTPSVPPPPAMQTPPQGFPARRRRSHSRPPSRRRSPPRRRRRCGSKTTSSARARRRRRRSTSRSRASAAMPRTSRRSTSSSSRSSAAATSPRPGSRSRSSATSW